MPMRPVAIRQHLEGRAAVVAVVIVLVLLVFPDVIATFGTGGMLGGLVEHSIAAEISRAGHISIVLYRTD
jgi:hypothetical protein